MKWLLHYEYWKRYHDHKNSHGVFTVKVYRFLFETNCNSYQIHYHLLIKYLRLLFFKFISFLREQFRCLIEYQARVFSLKKRKFGGKLYLNFTISKLYNYTWFWQSAFRAQTCWACHVLFYKVGFSKVIFAKISLGTTYIVLRSDTFEKNSKRRTFS